MAILAAAITPMVMQRLIDGRIEATKAREKQIYEAMTGPEDRTSSFGFVGDMGRFPTDYSELMVWTNQPIYTPITTRNVGYGWRGPYVHFGDSVADTFKDAFGRTFGGAGTGQVRSAGPDGIFGNEDDINYPLVATPIYGRLIVHVKYLSEGIVKDDPIGVGVRLYYALNGIEQSLVAPAAPYVFENVPMGLHAIQVIGVDDGSVMRQQQTVSIPGNGETKLVEIFVWP
jgi:hypothetical protein